ncbi:hypothetical protein LCGC14_0276200 [marine sediment metagenome]|uniref:IrrE N-terminal-like domain-containing protein n=1 Tax=marine sediment metagenome TaxID=412755 RepID=A0A0F9X2X3_9ZZZZ
MLFSGIVKSLSKLGYGTSVDDPRIPDYAEARLLRSDFLVAVRRRDTSDMCYSLAHELGHIISNPRNDLVSASEIKADLFACSLLLMFGIDKSKESAEYVLGWLRYGPMRDTFWIAQREQEMRQRATDEAHRIWRYIKE